METSCYVLYTEYYSLAIKFSLPVVDFQKQVSGKIIVQHSRLKTKKGLF